MGFDPNWCIKRINADPVAIIPLTKYRTSVMLSSESEGRDHEKTSQHLSDRGQVQHRNTVHQTFGADSLAAWLALHPLQERAGHDLPSRREDRQRATSLRVRRLPLSILGDGWDDLP